MLYEDKRKNLVKNLETHGYIKTLEVKNAFLNIKRENFIPESMKNFAYFDNPLSIGKGQTISAPHMVAIMCEALDIKKGQKILEIGSGSGYHAAIVSKIIGDKGHLYSIERFNSLAAKAENNLKIAGIKNVTIIVGDGSEGYSSFAPYKRIYVTCAAPKIPQPLLDQLNDPGKLLVPVGDFMCDLKFIEKKNGKIIKNNLGGCAFVPLVGKYGF
jgi:protein-L-isoaspartate(D-aspartate) O-methyltransferase